MKIADLFRKPVDRPIEGVIKADDERYLTTELEEYVITRDVAKRLSILTDRYLTDRTANGVWISGFFGSGKSHLLKILSLILNTKPLDSGIRPADILLPKIEDAILQADLRKSASIPAQSILFNIDQKFDSIGGDHSSAILDVFVKVFNDSQGYYGKQGYLAKFESDLDIRGDFAPFQATYLRINGRPWTTDREAISTAYRGAFTKAYSEHFGVPESEAATVIRQVREDYKVSIESFAQSVKSYISRQPAGFRLNFFVDEVGQFIGQNSKLMLNLQTVAESLATACNGNSWVFVTSQADLEGVLGNFKGMEATDLSKIAGRFNTKLTLASADVREVIQKRLLAKTEPEPESLTSIYDREKDNLETLFRFCDNSRSFKGWRGSDEFCDFYPFHPYQFDLFQLAIQQLSAHNVFTGKYLSVGERSMLAVFQEVAKAIQSEQIGRLATFDLMYDGIAASIRGDMQTGMKMAERKFGEGLELRILKALFLLKWVREFKASSRNVAILLIDSPNCNILAHEKAIRDALNHLENQSYLQRNGDLYEFLTDIEKDIETEIKNTELDETKVTKLLSDTVFDEVLRLSKIRHDANSQDYPFARKIDDQLVDRDAEISIHIATAENFNHANPAALAMQTAGRRELLAVLPADPRLLDQARIILKTRKYVQLNSSDPNPARKAIVEQRGQQNNLRLTSFNELAKELLGTAALYINGSRLDTVGEGDARNRFAKACQLLIAFAFPNLRMLKGVYDESTLSTALLDPNQLLFVPNQSLTEDEQEIHTYVLRNQSNGDRTSIEEILRNFTRPPFGWPNMATLTLIARLFRLARIELRNPDLLEPRAALELLRNPRQHGGIRVRIHEAVDPAKLNRLKTFHHEFFHQPNPGTDARSIGQASAAAFTAKAARLSALLQFLPRYPFLKPLDALEKRLSKLADKDPSYLIKNLDEFEDTLLTAEEDVISPIEAFMNGPQRAAYDEAIAFLREEEANFAELPPADVQPLRDLAASLTPFRGSLVPGAKAAVAKLRTAIAALLQAEREQATAELDKHESQLQAIPEFVALDQPSRELLLSSTQAARAALKSERFVSGIRDRQQRYTTREYPAQLTLANRLAAPSPAADATGAAPALAPIRYKRAADLKAECGIPYITTPEDLDIWLTALRIAAQAELDKGNRLSL